MSMPAPLLPSLAMIRWQIFDLRQRVKSLGVKWLLLWNVSVALCVATFQQLNARNGKKTQEIIRILPFTFIYYHNRSYDIMSTVGQFIYRMAVPDLLLRFASTICNTCMKSFGTVNVCKRHVVIFLYLLMSLAVRHQLSMEDFPWKTGANARWQVRFASTCGIWSQATCLMTWAFLGTNW